MRTEYTVMREQLNLVVRPFSIWQLGKHFARSWIRADSHVDISSDESFSYTTQEALNHIVNLSNESVNVADYLEISEKGYVKWNGSFEDLKDFVKCQQISEREVDLARWWSQIV